MLKTIKLILALFSNFIIFSQTNTWTGATDTDWHKACNWSLNVIPTCAHNTVIPNTTNKPSVTGIAHCSDIQIQSSLGARVDVVGSGRLDVGQFGGCTGTPTDNGGCTPPLAATVTYAPSVANPGLPDPTIGSFTELLHVNPPASVTGLEKQVYISVHDISGGDGGPYSVDFSGITYSVSAMGCFSQLATGADIGWGRDGSILTTNAGQPISGSFPVTAVVTGVNGSGASHAFCFATVQLASVPGNFTPFTHRYTGTNTVTITDGSSNSLVLTLPGGSEGNTSGTGTYTDTWPYNETICP